MPHPTQNSEECFPVRVGGGEPQGDSHIKLMGVLVITFMVKSEVLVPLRVFRLKRFTDVAFPVPFRVK